MSTGVLTSFCSRFLSLSSKQATQLDFLLSKASEYSSFISRDLDELQAALSEKARQKAEKSEKRKKRKGSDAKASAKKAKGNSGEALKTALVKDAKGRADSKRHIIFTQPANLSDGCFLKDYQLEGVRWLVSLYENGVSGILADEVSADCRCFDRSFYCCSFLVFHFVFLVSSHHSPSLTV